ncbi:hypothetical protein M0802_009240 [Mischocyttarus mexicanus]|nr:hypothetical protein M0802_009240 [Mischocyttarus mexicanus]
MAQDYQVNEVDFFERGYYKLNQTFLSLIGLWPYSEPNKSYLRRLIVSSIFLVLFVVQISQLLEHIKQNWLEKEHIKEFQIMKKYAENGRTYSLIIILLSYGLILSALFVSTIPLILDIYSPLNQTRHRILPFPMEFFIDIQRHYLLVLLITFFMTVIACTAVVGNYTLFAILVYYTCGMFCVVGNMLDGIKTEYLYNRYTENEVHVKIVRSIEYHQKTLEFDIPWYMLSTKSQMLLLFMMMRSLKPCYFLIINFLTLSVKLSMSVIQTTLSYAMVIYSVQ